MDEFEDAEAVETVANRVTPAWDRVVEDMEATADAYREDGWDAIECHPGDVTAVGDGDVQRDDARTGVDVLVPDDEFDRAAAAVDGPGEFDEVNVFRAEENGIVFFVAALENGVAETVILVPGYYGVRRSGSFLETVEREDELRLHVRPLDQRRVLTFTQRDPGPFIPSRG
ncbi:DUF7529 family protein [Halosolutus gelatinilyticus]|uniref:DUF7529 family protein n=1 Tax=Halosolutus gelatinilyticus TaxID=2931975 RepID=UPI001FF5867B|nr:hypothetical protein [Halosolutus gelatinilyticus]